MNPCPCGHYTGGDDRCTCQPSTVRRYAGRVSGPLLDRIDLHVDVPAVAWRDLRDRRRGEESATVRARVEEARARAARRLSAVRTAADDAAGDGASGARGDGSARAAVRPVNATLTVPEIERFCRLDAEGEDLLRGCVEQARLSARACHRILRVARTVADLAGVDAIASRHVLEAARFRVVDGPGGPPSTGG